MVLKVIFGFMLVVIIVVFIGVVKKFDLFLVQIVGIVLVVVIFFYFFVWLSYFYLIYFLELRYVFIVLGNFFIGQFFIIIIEECGVFQCCWYKEFGFIICYYFFFGVERLFVVDDEVFKYMMVKNLYNYFKFVWVKFWMVCIFGEGIFFVEGIDYVVQCKVFIVGFFIGVICLFMFIFWEKFFIMVKFWKEEMIIFYFRVKLFEVLEWLNCCIFDIIGKVGFGYDINFFEDFDVFICEVYCFVFVFDFFFCFFYGM